MVSPICRRISIHRWRHCARHFDLRGQSLRGILSDKMPEDRHSPPSLTSLLGALLLLVLASSLVGAAPSDIEAVTEQFCSRCHNSDTATAGIDFSALLTDLPLVRNREAWERTIAIVEARRMPPPSAQQPDERQRASLLEALDGEIRHFDYSNVEDPGFESLKRLTHTEYDHTIRDLFGVELNPTQRFTPEMSGDGGFDNSANTLFLQSSLMERYIAAAERVVEDALPETPRTHDHEVARKQIFVAYPSAEFSDRKAAVKLFERWLLRAFRRPATERELTQAADKFDRERATGKSYEGAVKSVLAATLISPSFLFRVEVAPPTDQATLVDDWAMASRLSYFLWATMPDDELFRLAGEGRLSQNEVLTQQIARMLADPKADTLATVFAAQWLGFGQVGDRVRLGPIDFPWCTDTLMDAMRGESSLFFMSLLRDDRPIAELIDADYTYVNEELARTLYGMENVQGDEMRRIELTDRNRGGLLGQGAILAVTSNYNQTSPVKRGHWILETLLGTPPPPPPPNAGVFDEEVSGIKDLTFREKLAMHSANEACRSCHEKMDPLGFSLENFDYFGRWRDTYTFRVRIAKADDPNVDPDSNFRKVVKGIDVAGKLPEGAVFSGPSGLKDVLIANRHDDLVRQVVQKMLSYALGRQLEYYDEPAIRKIIARLEANDYRFQTVLREIVTSYPFRYKKTPAMETD